jgi:hypothetical protein
MKQQEIVPNVEEKIITLRNQQVILDCDVAELYGVATKEINQAVRNNPEKFPEGYIFKLDNQEIISLRSKILTLKNSGRGQHTKYPPKAFTEKGLYMLATILKPFVLKRTISEKIVFLQKISDNGTNRI